MSKTSHFIAFLVGAAVTAGSAIYTYFNNDHFEPARNPPVVESPEPSKPPRLIVDTASLENTLNESGFPNILVGTRGENGYPDRNNTRTLIGVNHGLFVEKADAQAMINIRDGYLGEGPEYQVLPVQPSTTTPPVQPSTPKSDPTSYTVPVQPSQPLAKPLSGPTFAPKYSDTGGWTQSSN